MNDVESSNSNWKLRPKARIMRTMGDELVSSEIVAIIELVKNAYDADATRVLIQFQGEVEVSERLGKEYKKLLKAGGRIQIIDNGHGMNLSTLQSVWMQPATANKRRSKQSPRGRRVLGEKGIGRFASSRLADELLVISREIGASRETQVIFDWTQFDDEERFLDEVEILWADELPHEILPGGSIEELWADQALDADKSHGTILRMDTLRDDWDEEKFQQLRNGLARLISPFFPVKNFQVFLQLPPLLERFSGPISPPELLMHPNYVIRGKVDAFGRYAFDMEILGNPRHLTGKVTRISDLETNDTIPVDNPDFEQLAVQSACGSFELELRVWDRDTKSLEQTAEKYGRATTRDVLRDLDSLAGISVYRDGFRVLPYGEPNDDWLRLDLRRTQNTRRLYNKQIIGYVLISRDNNPALMDQSNREGIVDSLALTQLQEMVVYTIALLEPERIKAREDLQPSPTTRTGGIFEGFNLDKIGDFVASKYPHDKELVALLRTASDDLAYRVSIAQDVISRYRRLATLGQLIDTVLHEGRAPLAKIGDRADSIMRLVNRANVEDCTEFVVNTRDRVSAIKAQAEVLAQVFQRIEPFGGRKRGRPQEVVLETIIVDSFNLFEEELRRSNIRVTLPTSEHKVTVDATELQQVMVNLIQNSIHWLQDSKRNEREIVVTTQQQRRGEPLEIVFSDSGPGVDEDDRPYIFDPYFSRRPNGVGLGLTLAGEIVFDYYNGRLELLDSGPLDGATFRILLRERV